MTDEVLNILYLSILHMIRNISNMNYSITHLSKTVNISKWHYERIFKEAFGIPPGKFLWSLRILIAGHYLVTTSDNIADIGTAVGFMSVGQFPNSFRKYTGMSPSAYRKARLKITALSVDSEPTSHYPKLQDLTTS